MVNADGDFHSELRSKPESMEQCRPLGINPWMASSRTSQIQVSSSPIPGNLEVGCRSCPKRLSEGCDKSAWGTIAGFKSCVSDLGAFAEKAHRVHQPELLSPFSQGHSCFFLKKPLHCSSARANRLANTSEGLPISRIGIENFRKSLRSWISQVRELQRHRLYRFELGDNHTNQMTMLFDFCAQ